jgi:hypothetical protein
MLDSVKPVPVHVFNDRDADKGRGGVRVQWVDHKCKVNSDEFDRVQE